jgi:hypothetical protein
LCIGDRTRSGLRAHSRTRRALAGGTHGHEDENFKQEESTGMFRNLSIKRGSALALSLLAATAMLSAAARTVRAQDLDESVRINGEVSLYVESTSTNFSGNYTQDTRGTGAWSGFFGEGQKDTYSFLETRFKEAELKVDKATKISDDWTMVNHLEFEFKTYNTGTDAQVSGFPYNDIDVEEASAKLQNASGLYVHFGILQDAHVYTPALLLDMAAGDDKGFDENPAVRVGYKMGDMDVNLRFTSQYVPKTGITMLDPTDKTGKKTIALKDKSINQTMIHVEFAYKIPDFLNALVYYTTITSANKENANFQGQVSGLSGANKSAYVDAGLDDTTVLAVSLAFQFDTIIPYVNLESWTTGKNAGSASYDTQIITIGVNLRELGPGDLIVATEQGTMTGDFHADPKKSGKFSDVAFSGYGAEYLFHTGKSLHGPGFKSFSNDAGEALSGTVIYYGSKWIF